MFMKLYEGIVVTQGTEEQLMPYYISLTARYLDHRLSFEVLESSSLGIIMGKSLPIFRHYLMQLRVDLKDMEAKQLFFNDWYHIRSYAAWRRDLIMQTFNSRSEEILMDYLNSEEHLNSRPDLQSEFLNNK